MTGLRLSYIRTWVVGPFLENLFIKGSVVSFFLLQTYIHRVMYGSLLHDSLKHDLNGSYPEYECKSCWNHLSHDCPWGLYATEMNTTGTNSNTHDTEQNYHFSWIAFLLFMTFLSSTFFFGISPSLRVHHKANNIDNPLRNDFFWNVLFLWGF